MLYGVPHRVLNRPAESSRGDGMNQASTKLAALDEEHNVQRKQRIVAEEKIQKLEVPVFVSDIPTSNHQVGVFMKLAHSSSC